MINDNQKGPNRRRFLTTMATVIGGAGAVATAVPFISTMMPSAKTKAVGAPVEADISGLGLGELKVLKWQGKPVWVLRRTPEMLAEIKASEENVKDPNSEHSIQPDYATNSLRALKDEFLVVVGICTHLGCSPKHVSKGANNAPSEAWQGGFVCPCHNSFFDLAGRVYKGMPAQLNLTVPPYYFISSSIIVIGEDNIS